MNKKVKEHIFCPYCFIPNQLPSCVVSFIICDEQDTFSYLSKKYLNERLLATLRRHWLYLRINEIVTANHVGRKEWEP